MRYIKLTRLAGTENFRVHLIPLSTFHSATSTQGGTFVYLNNHNEDLIQLPVDQSIEEIERLIEEALLS